MAEVYKSVHPDLGRDIAVKIVYPYFTDEPGFIERFRYEAQAVASLRHSNIVQVYDFSVTEDGLYYMVMEFIDGLSLEEYLREYEEPLPLSRTVFIFKQIAEALNFAHQRGTVHRDVKPVNIMIDAYDRVYLMDFGIAQMVGVSGLTHTGMTPGTPAYMSPEQIIGKETSSLSDIYSLGVILYRMLTQRFPYESDNPVTLLMKKTTEPPPSPRQFNIDIPPAVEDVILKGMAIDPDERYADAESMSRALQEAAFGYGQHEHVPLEVDIPAPRTTRSTIFPGRQIDNYKIKEELTQNEDSATRRYLADNFALDSLAMLEILKTSANDDTELADQFRRQMEIVSGIDHPNVAVITWIDVTPEDYPYAAIEHVQGMTLAQQLRHWRKEGLPPDVVTALTLVRQLADALRLAHGAGVIHHDLRPENIVLREEDGAPVIVGLGIPLSPSTDREPTDPDAIKYLRYASPEQLRGESLTDQSNVYSLGILLYELLAGKRPQAAVSGWNAVLNRAERDEQVPLHEMREGLTSETYQLVKQALGQQESDRLDSAASLLAALDAAIAAEQSPDAVRATVGTIAKPDLVAGQPLWRRMWPVGAFLAAVLLIVLTAFTIGREPANAEDPPPTNPVIAIVPTETSTNTPTLTPAATATALPIVQLDPISLTEPLPRQEIRSNQSVVFDWLYIRGLLKEDEQFNVYILDEAGNEKQIGTVTQPSFRETRYRLPVAASLLADMSGLYAWEVRLENSETGETILISESFDIRFTQVTPTPTNTATPEIASESGTLTVTPEPVCEPNRPVFWLEYSVKSGDSPSKLAEAANVPVEEVLEANCLEADVILSIGQEIFIPPPLPTATPSPAPTQSTATPRPNNGGNNGGDNPSPTSTSIPPTSTPPRPPTVDPNSSTDG